jgi:hypothetical protein
MSVVCAFVFLAIMDRLQEVSPKSIFAITAVASVTIVGAGILINRVIAQGEVEEHVPGRFRRLADALFKNAGGRIAEKSHSVHMPKVAPPELREVGAASITEPNERQYSDRRLYMQLRVLDVDLGAIDMTKFLNELKVLLVDIPCVLYMDAVSNNGVGLLTWAEDPAFFTDKVNVILSSPKIASKFVERKGWTMFGKTYSNGHEKDLEEFLFKKPIRNSTKDEWDWAIWYPLRRRGPFYVQPPSDQCSMLLAHAAIGKAFSDVNAAHDIRLKCFGMDPLDNEYVVGLVGDNFHGLSRVVEEMRKTRHTAEFLESLGPFFVGKKIWKSTLAS